MASKKNVEAIYPLSPMQQGMLFHTLYEPQAAMYFEQFGCTLRGPLDSTAFRRAWQAMVTRHPILRTAFVWKQQDRPLQAVFQGVELPWEEFDWRGLSAEDQQARLAGFLAADQARGFDLARPPLMRGTLIRLAEQTYRFILSHHHLLLDGWSLPLLLKEAFQSYETYRRGETPVLPTVRPYRDYINWLQTRDDAAAERFWQETLTGFATPTALPEGGDIAGGKASLYRERVFHLPAETMAQLNGMARQQQLTVGTLVQGAWALLLARYAGTEDVLFGVTVSGRPPELPGVESMVGLFINTLPLRLAVPEAQGLLPWLKDVLARQVALRQYEQSALAQIQEWSGMPRGSSLFETLLVFENYPLDRERLQESGLSLAIDEVEAEERTNYPLTAVVHPGEGLTVRLIYDTVRLTESAVERIFAGFQKALEGILRAPEARVSDVLAQLRAEQLTLLASWNATTTNYPREECIHGLFEAQAAAHPEAVALTLNDRSMTYGELNAQANQLAHYLRTLGVGPETLVGLCAERSLEMVMAILAILKAGGAYLPLDPKYPKERLSFMLQDAQAPVLLTQERLLRSLPQSNATVVCLDRDWEKAAGQPVENPENRTTAEHLAYAMYTSGSTGRPKGTAVIHRNVVRLVKETNFADFGPDQVFLLFAPISFDASTLELWGPLLNGGRLVIFPPELSSLEELGQVLKTRGVTTLWLTAGLFHTMVDERLGDLAGVRQLLAGGDVLSVPHVRQVLESLGEGSRLINGYGPTENTTFTCCYPMDRATRFETTVPIGRPISNTTVYVLDGKMQPVPIGVPGELLVGGDGLSRGYLNRPELTAERFVPNPFGPAGSRLYRTGDLVRYLPDGTLEFMGRIDQQVKIRGFRIELGEIEAVLAQHPAVREAVVRVWESRAGAKQLVAYFTPAQKIPPSLRELGNFLKRQLPEYMIPSSFVMLETLPLTPNGKVDRKALPSPWVEAAEPTDGSAPRNEVERQLAEIWCQVLGVEKVGIHSNFFEMGGDSILSIQLVARAARVGLHFTVKQVFRYPTVAELATQVSATAGVKAEQAAVTGEVPLLPIQRWFFELNSPEPQHFNQAFMLTGRAAVDPALLEKALGYLVEHHDALRMHYRRTERGWQQVNVAPGEAVPFSVIDLSGTADAELSETITSIANEVQAGLDLEAGLPMRCIWFDLGPARGGRLLWVIHHLVVDGFSWRVLLEDLETAYQQLKRGEAVQLPPKTTSFKYWAERMVAHAQSAAMQEERRYWLEALPGPAATLPLDTPLGQGADTEATTAEVGMSLTIEETRQLLQEVPKALQVEINDVLLTALAQALAAWTGEPAVRIDLEGHGREELFEDVDLSRTVGWFTAMYPVRLDLRGAETVDAALKRIKETLRQVPGHGLSYGVLRMLGDEETSGALRALPQATVRFNYMGQYDQGFGDEVLLIPVPESVGASISPKARRSHWLDVAGGVVREQLHFTWMYSSALYKAETIERVAGEFVAALRRVIEHAQTATARAYTPADFPSARLDQGTLDQFISMIGQGDAG